MTAVRKYQDVQRFASHDRPSARREVRGNVIQWRAEAVKRRDDRLEALTKLARSVDQAVQRDVGPNGWAWVGVYTVLCVISLASATWLLGNLVGAYCRAFFL